MTVEFQSTRPHGARHGGGVHLEHVAHVSIHAPARGATSGGRCTRPSRSRFNPRARTGRDNGCALADGGSHVSIHAPARGATPGPRHPRPLRAVSIHAPARGATWSALRVSHPCLFQSTRPHGARHRVTEPVGKQRVVSIHAPARGATAAEAPAFDAVGVSIHAPARGATSNKHGNGHAPKVSIHAPARGATGRLSNRAAEASVSIHAPARGATCAATCTGPPSRSFNPRARTGRDAAYLDKGVQLKFQSTRPHGARRARPGGRSRCARFNPRARTGRDAGVRPGPAEPAGVSIHAPARGATLLSWSRNRAVSMFQSTRPHGARPSNVALERSFFVFQSTRPHGARHGG